jgi:tetratricopeptide (TPR) repeat protein
LVIHKKIGDRRGEAADLANIGIAWQSLGDPERALTQLNLAILIARPIQDRRTEGICLWNMSLAFDNLGDRSQAIIYAKASLAIRDEIGDTHAGEVRNKLKEWQADQNRNDLNKRVANVSSPASWRRH